MCVCVFVHVSFTGSPFSDVGDKAQRGEVGFYRVEVHK